MRLPSSEGFFFASSRESPMPYLSAMLGRRIQDESGDTVGRLTDVVVEAWVRVMAAAVVAADGEKLLSPE